MVGGNQDKTRLTHLDSSGQARMVDVGKKEPTLRVASARADLRAREQTLAAIRAGAVKKGDVVAVARVAGIMAAKKTSELIPLCHPIALTAVEVDIELTGPNSVIVTATARTVGPTGVEMEALTAASVAALTIYDMCKSIDRGMTITEIGLLEKSGGKSGHWEREQAGDKC
jgi:cyclic pyranopterin monophosphate synthase